MISLQSSVNRELRNQVVEEFEKRYEEFTFESLVELQKIFPRVTENIKSSGQDWVRSLYDHVCALYSILVKNGVFKADTIQPDYISIAAALQYFVDPFDLIPDYSPGDGFIDDAIMINYCIQELSSDVRIELESLLRNNKKINLNIV